MMKKTDKGVEASSGKAKKHAKSVKVKKEKKPTD